MTDDEVAIFVTFCRKCGLPTKFAVEAPPQTAAELEMLRARIAEACPNHGEMTTAEVKGYIERGEFSIAPPVAAELREVLWKIATVLRP